VQEKETTNHEPLLDVFSVPQSGRILAIDPGTKRCGIAVCDELRLTTRGVRIITRSGWKKFLLRVKELVDEFDAVAVVVGLPLAFEGGESDMSENARDMARKLGLSLDVPLFLQDERATTHEARGRLWREGLNESEMRKALDAEAAAIILGDFLDRVRDSNKRET
jgi:putative Holliday junction resolvase